MTGRVKLNANAAVRAQQAAQLRIGGASWDQIAGVLGYANGASAVRAVRRYFGRVPQPSTDEMRELWRHRHELLWAQSQQSQKAIRDNVPGSLRSAVAVARSAAQLDGLDRPTRVELTTPDAQKV